MSNFWNKLNAMLSADLSIDQKETPRQKKKIWKFWVVLFVLIFGLFGVIGRLFYLQILEVDKYRSLAKRQHELKIDLPANRGIILDRNGKEIATNIMSLSVAVDPKVLKKKDEVCNIISKNLKIPYSNLLNKINNTESRFVWLVRGKDPLLLNDLYLLKDRGLILIEEPKRYYPYGESAAQIIGYTNIDNLGISGLEFIENEVLKGQDGYMIMRRDGKQRKYAAPDLPINPPKNGKNIKLTIDIDLQRIVQHELENGVKNSLADAGIAIAIKPKTGEILAICNYPFFNPNERTTIKSENTKLRAITDEYAPGSTFKLMTAAMALQENIVAENDSVYGFNGEMRFSWGTIRDVHGLGATDFKHAVWNSSNIIMANTAEQIEDRKFYSYLRNFGFGHKLEIDFPGEAPGKLKKPKDFNKSSKRYMGHGYDLTCTPIQLVNSYATVANGGSMMQPHIVKSIFDENENYFEKKPTKIRRVISEETSKRLWDLFVGVVDSGSGKRAKIEELKIAGKTGTSQKLRKSGGYSKSEYYASFAGFFPADDPEIALLIIVDRPRKSIYGGVNAAPIFKNIAQRWMSLTYTPESNFTESDSVLVPQFAGLNFRQAQRIAGNLGLELSASKDEGICFFQNPKPGEFVKKNTEIKLTLVNHKKSDSQPKYDLTGMPLKNALNLLHSKGIETEVYGVGNITKQKWSKDGDRMICKIYCG